MKNIDKIICTHCGDECIETIIQEGDNYFCCTGCQFVFGLLAQNNLSEYYEQIKLEGVKGSKFEIDEFSYLDNVQVNEQILNYKIENKSSVRLFTPQIYCSACLYLLENLFKLDNGIIESRVNFLEKEVTIIFDNTKTSLRKIVELLTALGYRPQLNLANLDKPKKKNYNKYLYLKLGVAGFAFGNMMLMALPEYFSGGNMQTDIKHFMWYLSLFFGLVSIYPAMEYFKSAYYAIKVKQINIDIPISIGIIALIVRSFVDILYLSGSGFVDSLTGLLFFLLLGRVFQQKTYHSLSFDRNYKSYFPLSVIKKNTTSQEYISVKDIKIGDVLIIRNNEIIPTDVKLVSEKAFIDYSFVTGESKPVEVLTGERIYSGGKQLQSGIEVEVIKEFHQSYLTELWNNQSFHKDNDSYISKLANQSAKYFTVVVLAISLISFAYWFTIDSKMAWNVFTAILIVACPCALALTHPFTYGTAMRVFGNNNLFIKNDKIVEYMHHVKKIIFDKTGTLTQLNSAQLVFSDSEIDNKTKKLIKSTVANSTHPISRIIFDSIDINDIFEVNSYQEIPGKGITAFVDGKYIKVGSSQWVNSILATSKIKENDSTIVRAESKVYVSIDDEVIGYYILNSKFRNKLKDIFDFLKNKAEVVILSGDNESEKEELQNIVGSDVEMRFNQMPDDKYKYILELQKSGSMVMMIGDGLNDAGALRQSDVGIAITESSANFTPGSDAILLAEDMEKLPKFFKLSAFAVRTVYYSLIISLLYNTIGIIFAVQGLLTPLIAAILMPVSSVTVVLFTVLRIKIYSMKLKLR